MGRDRCLICGSFIFGGEDTTRPPQLGVPVHRACYLRDEGLDEPKEPKEPKEPPSEEESGW
ncbi:MAG TPA: hypothetical protein VGT02_15865 [Methylomirabilota bacterium]|nr:hypothetical protein [Methylomirabilota bacterium]